MSTNHRVSIRTRSQPPETSGDSSFSEEGTDSQGFSGQEDNDYLDDQEDDGDLDQSDSVSSPGQSFRRSRSVGRQATRHHQPSRPPSGYNYRQAPPPASLDPSEDYSYGYGQHPPQGGGYYGRGRGGHGPQMDYAHSSATGFAPYGSGQVVPYGNNYHPFAPMNNGGNYFGGNPRGGGWGNEAMPYGGGYFNGPPGHYPVPMAMQQYQWGGPPPPPPTDIGPSRTPAPVPAKTPEPPKEDPEKEAMKKQLAEIRAAQEARDREAKEREMEAKIREEAEAAFRREMEQMKREDQLRAEERSRALERAKREIEQARKDAERATREAIEAERRAEAQRKKDEADAIARAERAARDMIEAERRAEDERKKAEAAAAVAAEKAAQLKLEAAIRAKEEAEEKAAKKAAEEAEWRKNLEEEAKLKAEIEARKKLEAEQKAAADEAAAAAAKKKEDEAFKKKALEEAKAAAQEANKKAMGKDKAPIKFKDAVGRKFSFPFHLCQTWAGMEELIKQAFLHVDVIGPHVQQGHYDLLGPNQEIILPQVWEKVVEPDWSITMHMWPMDQRPPPGLGPRPMDPRHLHGAMPMRPGMRPAGPPPPGVGIPVPPLHPGARGPQGPRILNVGPPHKERKKPSKNNTGLLNMFAGGRSAKKGKKRS